MKLEKLNDNQIRCTLSKSDLDKRKLRLSELAYGSAKARALFRDMIQQASIELGFEAENIPLMIEAIPISNDCLVLVMTKVEDPDELDTRFSRFSSPIDDEMAILDDETDFSILLLYRRILWQKRSLLLLLRKRPFPFLLLQMKRKKNNPLMKLWI